MLMYLLDVVYIIYIDNNLLWFSTELPVCVWFSLNIEFTLKIDNYIFVLQTNYKYLIFLLSES